ncbi:MAG: hypothetical protein OEY94_05065 [Alphaproteobacteria bacterium]|nr:hypothetical protein [Alphaproteobacteria bacterium]
MTEKRPDIVKLFIDSVTEHGAAKHLEHLRNEDKGKTLTGAQSKGDPLSAFDKEDFRQHLRQTLSDSNTLYFIDELNCRITFLTQEFSLKYRYMMVL